MFPLSTRRCSRRASLSPLALAVALLGGCKHQGGGSVSEVVAASGGTVTLPGGPTIVVPAGALPASVTITVAQTSQSIGGAPVWSFGPDGTTFATPVTVTLPVPGVVTQPVIYWSEADDESQFDELETVVSGSSAQASVTHFSKGYVGDRCAQGQCDVAKVVIAAPDGASVATYGLLSLGATPESSDGGPLGAAGGTTWSSSDSSTATVAPGSGQDCTDDSNTSCALVRGVRAGTATITAANGGFSASIAITVTPPPVAQVTIAPGDSTLGVAKSLTFTATPLDAQGNPLSDAVTWSSSDASVASIAAGPASSCSSPAPGGCGLVTAKKAGAATITATAGGQSGTVNITAIAPILSIDGATSFPLPLALPPICLPANPPQTFTISNAGPQGSVLDYQVINDGALAGFLEIGNASGSLNAGQSQQISVEVLDEFTEDETLINANLIVDVYTPEASNYIKVAIGQPIVGIAEVAQKLVGTWTGTWSGQSQFTCDINVVPISATASGNWSLTIDSVAMTDDLSADSTTGSATGSITWDGDDVVWSCTGSDNMTPTPGPFIPNRTLVFDATLATLTADANSCNGGNVLLNVDASGPGGPGDQYGPSVSATLSADALTIESGGFTTNPYNADETFVTQGTVTGSIPAQ